MKSYHICAGDTRKIHPDLVCDGIQHCPDKLDDENPHKCSEKYIKNNIMNSHGIHPCTTSNTDNFVNITILAVRCDDKQECLNGEDEKGCGEKTIVFRVVIICMPFVFILTLWILYRAIQYFRIKIQNKNKNLES